MADQRDYAREMREFIDTEANSPDPAPVLAERLVEKLRKNDPKLLRGWLDAQAVHFLRDAINHRDRSIRSHARATRGRSVFNDAAKQFEAGNADLLRETAWIDAQYTLADGSRPVLGDLGPEDLDWLADDYEQREASNRMEKAFIRAIRKKVPDGKVRDHLTEDQIRSIRSALGGE